jgi:hypothetical protein
MLQLNTTIPCLIKPLKKLMIRIVSNTHDKVFVSGGAPDDLAAILRDIRSRLLLP